MALQIERKAEKWVVLKFNDSRPPSSVLQASFYKNKTIPRSRETTKDSFNLETTLRRKKDYVVFLPGGRVEVRLQSTETVKISTIMSSNHLRQLDSFFYLNWARGLAVVVNNHIACALEWEKSIWRTVCLPRGCRRKLRLFWRYANSFSA